MQEFTIPWLSDPSLKEASAIWMPLLYVQSYIFCNTIQSSFRKIPPEEEECVTAIRTPALKALSSACYAS